MAIHIAILKPRYVALILRGRKTVESRLYRTKMPPVGQASRGERVYIKTSGGTFAAMARIAQVDEYADVTPAKITALARKYNRTVCADDAYWLAKRDSRFAVFITLCQVEPMDVGPAYVKSMRAWHVLDDCEDVVREYKVTAGAIRNRYAHLPRKVSNKPSPESAKGRIRLQLPDDKLIETDLTKGDMLR